MRYWPVQAAAVVAAGLFPISALANPTGPAVVSGTASFAANGSTLTVTAAPNTIVNWQTFSIGAGETTQFVQQSALSAVLNRVTTQNPSTILGALQSNGRVFLVNPSGILFAQGSRVDTAGLVASSLAMSDADFLAGRLRFAANGTAGPVLNDGTITTAGANAPVYLIGAAVVNGGVITSPGGEVVLAAGNSVEIADPGTPNITVQITAPANEAVNLGTILAPGGRLNIFAGLVQQLGAVQADTLAVGPDGAVVLGTTQPTTQAPFEAAAPAVATPIAATGETVSTPVPTLGTADAGSVTTSTTTTVPTLITGVPTLMTGVATLITGVPTLTSSAPTSGTTTFSSTSTVPTLSTGVPTLTSSSPTLTTGTPTVTTTAPVSTIATPTFSTVAPAPFEATIPLQ
jgi:filamentous hemagglutinin family protein